MENKELTKEDLFNLCRYLEDVRTLYKMFPFRMFCIGSDVDTTKITDASIAKINELIEKLEELQ